MQLEDFGNVFCVWKLDFETRDFGVVHFVWDEEKGTVTLTIPALTSDNAKQVLRVLSSLLNTEITPPQPAPPQPAPPYPMPNPPMWPQDQTSSQSDSTKEIIEEAKQAYAETDADLVGFLIEYCSINKDVVSDEELLRRLVDALFAVRPSKSLSPEALVKSIRQVMSR